MKKIFTTLFIVFSCCTFSQSIIDFDFEKYTKPNPENELSRYFKEKTSKKLLRKVKFNPQKQNIVLYFFVNKDNKPYNIQINSLDNPLLKQEIINIFKNYPLEKLSSNKLDTKSFYGLQIISKKKNKPIFNCSSLLAKITPPICKECEELEYFEDIKTCLNQEVTKHFYKNANFKLLDSQEENSISLFIKFKINENGSLINYNSKVPKIFENEVVKILKSFPTLKEPGSLIGIKHQIKINYNQENLPSLKNYKNKINVKVPSQINTILTTYLQNRLTEEDILRADLNKIYNKLTISFQLNDKKQPYNFYTNARSSSLNEKIISIFKNYPKEQLNFYNTNTYNSYYVHILLFSKNQVLIQPNKYVNYRQIPIFPGCEKSKDTKTAKECFKKNIQKNFVKKFDYNLPNNLNLSKGRINIFIKFRINKEGIVENIIVRAPHPKIKSEVKKIMKQLPRIKPAEQNTKKINMNFTIPFTLIVQ